MAYRGLDRVQVEEVEAGDIIAVAGLAEATVPDTVGVARSSTAPLHRHPRRSADPGDDVPRQRRPARPARKARRVTSRQIRERLMRETQGNVAIKITESNESDAIRSGRPRRTSARRVSSSRCAARALSSPSAARAC